MTQNQRPITAQVATQIRTHRRQQGMTQETLATKAGFKRTNLAAIETGARGSIAVDEVYAIAEALDVAPAALMPNLGGRLTFDQALQLVRDRYAEAIERLQAT